MVTFSTSTPTARPRTTRHPWLAMIPLLLGILIGALAISSVSTALPAIREDLILSDSGALWLVDVYALSLAATLIVAARIGDAFGRKRIVILGLAGFAVLNVVGGFAQDGMVLIVVRALLGVAEAFVVAGVVATIGAHYQARQRVLAYGLWTATFGAGSALGPVLGGVVTEGPGWRWLLLGSVPLAVLAGVLAIWLVPDSRSSRPPSWDALSIGSSIVALGALAFALHEVLAAPIPAAVAGAVAVATLVSFIRRQRILQEPLIDMRLFQVPGFSPAIVRIVASGGVSSATVLLVSLHLQDARGHSAAEAGLAILPQAVAIALGGVLAPLFLRWLSSPTLTVLALVVQGAGLVWLSTGVALVVMPLVLVGLGFGITATLAATTLFDVTTEDDAGQVGAIQEVGFALGGGLGIAVLGTIASIVGPGGFTVALLVAAVAVVAAALLPLWRRTSTDVVPAPR
ncbi:DHA2 family multidrug resistance protein-like MFS transporter [Microbacterium saperdae]|uniref:DHA2 family multidrug resistance protein-like MFS transporter n=1 Tax=Microbacterium saperdae TaxID=69368 RepID=A0A543BAU1_9MICO|nr:DHA2 family multidrug resistance protein-like MFS transporter [Microbacterium saperdae]